MKKKLKVVTAVLLVIAVVGIGIYSNQRVTSKQALQASTVDTNDVVGVDENGFKDGTDGTEVPEVPEAIIPVDPNKMLSSGFTIQEIKQKLADTKSKYVGKHSEADINELLTTLAKTYGTTLEELARVAEASPDVVPPKVETPAAVTQPAVSKPAVNKPAVSKPAVTQPSAPAAVDNGASGMDDAFKGSYSGPGGGTVTPEHPLVLTPQ